MTTPYPGHPQLRGNYAPIRMECDIDDVIVRGELPRDLDIASMMHDFIVTEEHVVFPVFPLTASRTRAIRGKPVFAWEPDKGTHLAVMRRDGSVADIRWFETDPCYVFHPMNAYTDGNRIVAHVMQFDEAPLFPNADGTPTVPAQAHLTEWIIDLAENTNVVQHRPLDDTVGEFPRLDERFAGTTYRHGYYAAVSNGSTDLTFNSIVRHDFASGRHTRYGLPDGDTTGEPVFVPKSRDAAEGDGYLLSVVHRGRENRSDLAFFDAENLADGPIACAELPHRVPYGFHGNWKYNDVS